MAGWGGWAAFIAYWVSGLTFDLYHAAGNLAFYPIFYLPLVLGLDRFKRKQGGSKMLKVYTKVGDQGKPSR